MGEPRRAGGRWVLAAAAACTFACALGLPRLRSDNSPRAFFPQEGEALADFEESERAFGTADGFRVVASGPAPVGDKVAWCAALALELRDVAGVREARAPWIARPGDEASTVEQVRSDGIARALGLASADGAHVGVLVTLRPGARIDEVLADAERRVSRAPAALGARVIGPATINRRLDLSAGEIGSRFMPALTVVALLVLAVSLRRLGGVLVALAFVAGCEVIVLGLMGWSGVALNLVVGVLPPVVFVVALATALHVQSSFDVHWRAGAPAARAASLAVAETRWSLLWSGATTAVGFASLGGSRAPPVQVLGAWCAAGTACVTLAALVVLPALLAAAGGGRVRPAAPARHALLERFGAACARLGMRHRAVVLAALAASAAVSLASLPHLGVETNALRFFPEGDALRRDVERLEEAGMGVTTVDVVVRGAALDLATAEGLAPLGAFAADLRRDGVVTSVVSADDVVDESARRLRLARPLLDRTSSRALALSSLASTGALAGLVDASRGSARVVLFVRQIDAARLDRLRAHVETAAARLLPGAGVTVTGEYPMLLEAQRALLGTLAISLGATALACFGAFLAVMRSVRGAIAAMVPNAWPIACMLGAMAWWEVPVDIATVMVASIVLGLAVDDTFHSIGLFRSGVGLGESRAAAVAGGIARTAPAHVTAGIVLAAGFGACALSSFAPIRRFGMLASGAIVLAVLADLLVVPALFTILPDRAWRFAR